MAVRSELAATARGILEAAWRGEWCVPNTDTYPWQWLWDSAFHAVVWAHLGDERALVEIDSALDDQADDGFVPHIHYRGGPNPHAAFWGRSRTSSITQPPMVGHALAEAQRLGLCPADRAARPGDCAAAVPARPAPPHVQPA